MARIFYRFARICAACVLASYASATEFVPLHLPPAALSAQIAPVLRHGLWIWGVGGTLYGFALLRAATIRRARGQVGDSKA